ncbi:hypothetical protein [Rhodohalobacter sp. 614A]|uniref:hypothetical protein n=1 Tax=Rhodohalobacter sp. 614A TaxID=2908649 RepID=UPI001F1B2A10|nr:hypothetical protein [Rhodohalobacter sp. 614A]
MLRKNIPHICIAIIFFVVTASCIQQGQDYAAVEIDFLNVKNLKEGDWIEIDGVRFSHVKAFEEVNEQKLTLPASRITRGAQQSQRDNTNPFPSLNIGYLLATYLHDINKEEQLMMEHDHTYKILNPDLVYALGKLQFMRVDSTKVHIKTSSNYPAKIRPIPL